MYIYIYTYKCTHTHIPTYIYIYKYILFFFILVVPFCLYVRMGGCAHTRVLCVCSGVYTYIRKHINTQDWIFFLHYFPYVLTPYIRLSLLKAFYPWRMENILNSYLKHFACREITVVVVQCEKFTFIDIFCLSEFYQLVMPNTNIFRAPKDFLYIYIYRERERKRERERASQYTCDPCDC